MPRLHTFRVACLHLSRASQRTQWFKRQHCTIWQVAMLKQQLDDQDSAQQQMLRGMRDDITFWQRRAMAAEVLLPPAGASPASAQSCLGVAAIWVHARLDAERHAEQATCLLSASSWFLPLQTAAVF